MSTQPTVIALVGLLAATAAAKPPKPPPLPAPTRSTEHRVLVLTEEGRSHLRVSREVSGPGNEALRDELRSTDAEELRVAQADRAGLVPGAKRLISFSASSPDDEVAPLRLAQEFEDGARDATGQDLIPVRIPLAALLERAPDGPLTAELTFDITPPLGFVARTVPKVKPAKLGPATLKRELELEKDGRVTGLFRFELKPARLKPAQLGALEREVAAALAKPPLELTFVRLAGGNALVARVRQVLALARAGADAQPRDPRVRAGLAEALLAAGAAEEAREEARRAVELDPASPRAHRVLAEVLERDLFGRRLGRGFDRAGAIAAYRKARELDPADHTVRLALADLLSRDERAVRYRRGADLPAAIFELRALRDELGVKDGDEDLLVALLFARRFPEAGELAAKTAESPRREAVRLAALAAGKGAPAAMEAAKALPPATRREVLETAGRWLLALRLYPAAAALLAGAAEAGPKSPQLTRLAGLAGKAVRFEELEWPNQPATPVKRLLLNLVLGAPFDASKDLFAARALEFAPRAATDAQAQAERFRAALEGDAFPIETVTDLFLAGVTLNAAGDDGTGYPVAVSFEGLPATAWFVISEGGGYRVLASAESTPGLAGLGAEALARAVKENPVEAKALLGWARRALAGRKAPGAPREVFASIWPGPNINPATEFRLAVSCLMAEGGAEKIVKHLQEQRALALSDALAWDLDRVSVAANATAGRWKDNLLVVKRWEDRRGHAAELADIRVEAFTELGQWAELRAASLKYADLAPEELRAIEYATEGALHAGDFDAVDPIAERLVEPARPSARLLYSRARAALYGKGRPDRRGIEWAEKALRLEPSSPERQLTLAALYAEAERVTDARAILGAALEAGPGEAPPIAWYVQGRLAESYGLPGSARRAYERVLAAPRAPADDPAALAKRRLGELTRAANSPGKRQKTR